MSLHLSVSPISPLNALRWESYAFGAILNSPAANAELSFLINSERLKKKEMDILQFWHTIKNAF